jgi:hypothetical protein
MSLQVGIPYQKLVVRDVTIAGAMGGWVNVGYFVRLGSGSSSVLFSQSARHAKNLGTSHLLS